MKIRTTILLTLMLFFSVCSQATIRNVVHMMGTTQVSTSPQRIVTLTNEATEALLALGIKPVGAVRSLKSGDPWYLHIETEMTGVQIVGVEKNVNLEVIAALKPDLIIGSKLRQAKIYPILSMIAPTVFSNALGGQWQSNFTLYANAVNKPEKGVARLAAYQQRIEALQAQLGDKLKQQVSVIRFLPGQVRIYRKASFSGNLLAQLGFPRPEIQNVDDFAIKNVGKERIPDFEGDVLLYFVLNNDSNIDVPKVVNEWMAEPLWQRLDVVKRGQVYEVSDVFWNSAGGILAAELALNDIPRVFNLDD